MEINHQVKFKGEKSEIIANSLIDTGASISIIPLDIAIQIGAWETGQQIEIVGVNNQRSIVPLGAVIIQFPQFNNIGSKVVIPVSENQKKPIIGMDILSPLGFIIDTKNKSIMLNDKSDSGFKDFYVGVGKATLFIAGTVIIINVLKEIFRKR